MVVLGGVLGGDFGGGVGGGLSLEVVLAESFKRMSLRMSLDVYFVFGGDVVGHVFVVVLAGVLGRCLEVTTLGWVPVGMSLGMSL